MPWGYAAAGLLGGQLLGGAGGGGGSPTQTTTNYNAVSSYAAPYVENMLGATQGLLYNVDAEGKPTGLKGYEAYPGQRTALFTDLQNKAFERGENMGVMGQTQQATDLASRAGLGALDMNYQAGQFQNQFQAPGEYQAGRFRADRVGTQTFTQPGMAEDYMSPYMQGVVGLQQREARRASDIAGQQQAAQAVGRGAFGGSRDAIMRAERERNLATQLGDIQATGSQAAFQQAQQQFNAEQARRLAAQQSNQQFGWQAQQLG